MLAWLKALTIGKKIALGGITLVTATAIATPTPPPVEQPPESAPAYAQQEMGVGVAESKPKIEAKITSEIKTISETKTIPFTTREVKDANLAQGKTVTRVSGKNGTKTITYEVTYTDGIETGRKKISEKITTQPVNALVAKGTYVAPKVSTNCTIKGNISRATGEKIYHVPGGQYYDATIINEVAGERWFCTEAEAQAAGWRKSMR